MLIVAFKKVSPLDIFQKDVLRDLSSIFITAAFLRVLQSMIFLLETAKLCNRKKKKRTASQICLTFQLVVPTVMHFISLSYTTRVITKKLHFT